MTSEFFVRQTLWRELNVIDQKNVTTAKEKPHCFSRKTMQVTISGMEINCSDREERGQTGLQVNIDDQESPLRKEVQNGQRKIKPALQTTQMLHMRIVHRDKCKSKLMSEVYYFVYLFVFENVERQKVKRADSYNIPSETPR